MTGTSQSDEIEDSETQLSLTQSDIKKGSNLKNREYQARLGPKAQYQGQQIYNNSSQYQNQSQQYSQNLSTAILNFTEQTSQILDSLNQVNNQNDQGALQGNSDSPLRSDQIRHEWERKREKMKELQKANSNSKTQTQQQQQTQKILSNENPYQYKVSSHLLDHSKLASASPKQIHDRIYQVQKHTTSDINSMMINNNNNDIFNMNTVTGPGSQKQFKSTRHGPGSRLGSAVSDGNRSNKKSSNQQQYQGIDLIRKSLQKTTSILKEKRSSLGSLLNSGYGHANGDNHNHNKNQIYSEKALNEYLRRQNEKEQWEKEQKEIRIKESENSFRKRSNSHQQQLQSQQSQKDYSGSPGPVATSQRVRLSTDMNGSIYNAQNKPEALLSSLKDQENQLQFNKLWNQVHGDDQYLKSQQQQQTYVTNDQYQFQLQQPKQLRQRNNESESDPDRLQQQSQEYFVLDSVRQDSLVHKTHAHRLSSNYESNNSWQDQHTVNYKNHVQPLSSDANRNNRYRDNFKRKQAAQFSQQSQSQSQNLKNNRITPKNELNEITQQVLNDRLNRNNKVMDVNENLLQQDIRKYRASRRIQSESDQSTRNKFDVNINSELNSAMTHPLLLNHGLSQPKTPDGNSDQQTTDSTIKHRHHHHLKQIKNLSNNGTVVPLTMPVSDPNDLNDVGPGDQVYQPESRKQSPSNLKALDSTVESQSDHFGTTVQNGNQNEQSDSNIDSNTQQKQKVYKPILTKPSSTPSQSGSELYTSSSAEDDPNQNDDFRKIDHHHHHHHHHLDNDNDNHLETSSETPGFGMSTSTAPQQNLQQQQLDVQKRMEQNLKSLDAVWKTDVNSIIQNFRMKKIQTAKQIQLQIQKENPMKKVKSGSTVTEKENSMMKVKSGSTATDYKEQQDQVKPMSMKTFQTSTTPRPLTPKSYQQSLKQNNNSISPKSLKFDSVNSFTVFEPAKFVPGSLQPDIDDGNEAQQYDHEYDDSSDTVSTNDPEILRYQLYNNNGDTGNFNVSSNVIDSNSQSNLNFSESDQTLDSRNTQMQPIQKFKISKSSIKSQQSVSQQSESTNLRGSLIPQQEEDRIVGLFVDQWKKGKLSNVEFVEESSKPQSEADSGVDSNEFCLDQWLRQRIRHKVSMRISKTSWSSSFSTIIDTQSNLNSGVTSDPQLRSSQKAKNDLENRMVNLSLERWKKKRLRQNRGYFDRFEAQKREDNENVVDNFDHTDIDSHVLDPEVETIIKQSLDSKLNSHLNGKNGISSEQSFIFQSGSDNDQNIQPSMSQLPSSDYNDSYLFDARGSCVWLVQELAQELTDARNRNEILFLDAVSRAKQPLIKQNINGGSDSTSLHQNASTIQMINNNTNSLQHRLYEHNYQINTQTYLERTKLQLDNMKSISDGIDGLVSFLVDKMDDRERKRLIQGERRVVDKLEGRVFVGNKEVAPKGSMIGSDPGWKVFRGRKAID